MTNLVAVPTDQLDAALSSAGCPICRLRREREMRFIANVLDDWVVAAMVRAEFIGALGYCSTHAWLQQSSEWSGRRDGSTTADMYRYVLLWNLDGLEIFNWLSRHLLKLEQLVAFVRPNHHNGSDQKPAELQHAWRAHVYLPAGLVVKGQCPVCEAGEQSERSRLPSLLERLTSPEFQAKYRVSDGLCLPHLNQALGTLNDPQLRQFLVQVMLDKLEAAAGRLHCLSEQPDAPSQVSQTRRTTAQALARLVGNRSAVSQAIAVPHGPRSLDEALTQDACPLCLLTTASRHDERERGLIDPTVEEPLCQRHAWQLYDWAIAQSREPEFTALINAWVNRTSAQLRAGELNHRAAGDRSNGRWRGRIKQHLVREPIEANRRAPARLDCPMCRSEAVVQEKHLRNFLERLADSHLRRRYAASRGLCLPHLRAALQTAVSREVRLFLTTTARDRVANLIHLIEEYERKHIWNYRDEPKLAEEQNSWIRAVAFEVGEQLWAWKIFPIQ